MALSKRKQKRVLSFSDSVTKKLSELRNTLPPRVLPIIYNFPNSVQKAKWLVKGEYIVRPLVLFSDGSYSDSWEYGNQGFKKTERDTFLFRINIYNINCPLPCAESHEKKGFVCFSDTKPPTDWIYFKIDGVSRDKNAFFVTPVSGDIHLLLKLYEHYRK